MASDFLWTTFHSVVHDLRFVAAAYLCIRAVQMALMDDDIDRRARAALFLALGMYLWGVNVP